MLLPQKHYPPVKNIDAIETADNIGIRRERAANYRQSKEGYEAKFSKEELRKAVKQGVIDENVFALSGIEPSKFSELKEIGFSAAAIMGFLWK